MKDVPTKQESVQVAARKEGNLSIAAPALSPSMPFFLVVQLEGHECANNLVI